MALRWSATEGDFGRILCLVLSDLNGPIDLTGATCTFSMGSECEAVIDAAAAQPDVDQVVHKGRICYSFAAGELVAGHWDATFHAQWGSAAGFTGPTEPVQVIVGRKPAVAPPPGP